MRVTYHAVVRYRDRVRHGEVRTIEAREELTARLADADPRMFAPPWLAGDRSNDRAIFLMLDSDTCAVLCDDAITTVVTREWAEEYVRHQAVAAGWARTG